MGSPMPCPAQGMCHSLLEQLLGKGRKAESLARLVLNSASALQEQPEVLPFPTELHPGVCIGWPSHATPTMAFGGTAGVGKDLLELEQGCPRLWALTGQGEVISHGIRSEV